MNKLLILIKGELQRLNKYNVTTISFVVALIWFLLLYFIKDSDLLASLLPLIIVLDATMMAVLYVGAMMFFEKTEFTFSTMLVTPISNQDMILSKVIANTIHTLFSSLLIIIVFFFLKDVTVNWPLVILALILSVSFHSLLGFVFSYHSKDFTSMLVGVMMYSFVFLIPPMLNYFNIIFKGETWEYILLIIPTQATIKLIEVGFGADITIKFFISLAVITFGGFALFKFYVLRKFKDYAVKQSGV
jgi:fluoroquinolone transport system permease protein